MQIGSQSVKHDYELQIEPMRLSIHMLNDLLPISWTTARHRHDAFVARNRILVPDGHRYWQGGITPGSYRRSLSHFDERHGEQANRHNDEDSRDIRDLPSGRGHSRGMHRRGRSDLCHLRQEERRVHRPSSLLRQHLSHEWPRNLLTNVCRRLDDASTAETFTERLTRFASGVASVSATAEAKG